MGMSADLSAIRFSPERELLELLFDRFGLESILSHYEESGQAAPYYEFIMGSQLKLTPLLAPRLLTLLTEVREALTFDEPIDLFVQPSADINAFSMHSLKDKPHVVSLNSGLIERMSDDEIRFVLGHEIGHLSYRHYRARLVGPALGEDEQGISRVPPLLHRRLESWDRQAELSADRAGFTAAGGDIQTIIPAFFKMTSGLGPEHLRFDATAFLAQLEYLQKLERREVLATFSHPTTPVRVRALQLFAECGACAADPDVMRGIDSEVAALARLMDLEVTEPIEVHSRDFLVAAGLLVTQVGGTEVNREQADLLLHLVLPLSADPEAELARVRSAEQAEQLLSEATGWLVENAGTERFALYVQLAHVVAVDGQLSDPEREWMLILARRMKIPEKKANEILYEALGEYLQTQASMKTPRFGFREAPEQSG
jgi:hypothetical protein